MIALTAISSGATGVDRALECQGDNLVVHHPYPAPFSPEAVAANSRSKSTVARDAAKLNLLGYDEIAEEGDHHIARKGGKRVAVILTKDIVNEIGVRTRTILTGVVACSEHIKSD
jgi:hypothetical protein